MPNYSTVSNYISKINEQYPVAGQDNSTQGFRDNFKNIRSALDATNEIVYDLTLGAVKTTESNDFNNNVIERAVFQNCSTLVYDDSETVRSGNITVDYQNGSYQKFKVDSGLNTFYINNLPATLKSGGLTIAVTTASVSSTYINFGAPNLVNLGPEGNPFQVTDNIAQIFNLWNDGDANTLYVKKLNDHTVAITGDISSSVITGTNITAVQSFTLSGNKFTVNNDLSNAVTTGSKSGSLALLPNQVSTTITSAPVPDTLGDTVASTIPIASVVGISVGATVNIAGSTNPVNSVVTSIISNSLSTAIVINPAVQAAICVPGTAVVVTNDEFDYQPRLMTLASTSVSSTAAVLGDLRGQVHADATNVYVTYDDYAYNTDNKVKLVTDATLSTAVSNALPTGSIILWFGATTTIPAGWTLCDGNNSTPDLRNKFVVGAGGTYAVDATGGSADAVLVTHDHTASFSGNALPTHFHKPVDGATYGTTPGGGGGIGGGDFNSSSGDSNTSAVSAGTPSGSVTVNSSGVSSTNANLPPYYALCYIMKT